HGPQLRALRCADPRARDPGRRRVLLLCALRAARRRDGIGQRPRLSGSPGCTSNSMPRDRSSGRPSPTNRLVGALTCSDSDMSVHGRYAEESQGLSTTPSSPKGDTTMGLIGLIISWIIIGGIIGLIARAL